MSGCNNVSSKAMHPVMIPVETTLDLFLTTFNGGSWQFGKEMERKSSNGSADDFINGPQALMQPKVLWKNFMMGGMACH